MSGIFGVLGLPDTDRSFVNTIGQRVVYDAARELLNMYNAELRQMIALFCDFTSDHKLRYKLPGGGRLQRRGGSAQSGNVAATGQWDVAFPLEDFGAALGADRVAMAYMRLDEFQRHLDTVFTQDANTMRYEILKALLNNTQRTFVDPIYGNLLIEPLANGDGTLYPPVLGSETEADDTHHLETNYAPAAISDTNNPVATAVAELEEHFGSRTGGSNILHFINPDSRAKIEALTGFNQVPDQYAQPGVNTALAVGLPGNVPGRILGRVSGAWVIEWRWMPATYQLTVHADAPKPLMIREDPPDTGLATGLQLINESDDTPFENAHYAHRFGVGAANRLNGVVLELGTGGTYSIPTGYS